jgi:hypothetical protein
MLKSVQAGRNQRFRLRGGNPAGGYRARGNATVNLDPSVNKKAAVNLAGHTKENKLVLVLNLCADMESPRHGSVESPCEASTLVREA